MPTVLSDIDGVLIDSKTSVYKAYRAAFHNQGQSFTILQFEQLLWNQTWNETRMSIHFPHIDFHQLRADKHRFFKEGPAPMVNRPFERFLIELKNRGWTVLLVTSGSQEATVHKLQSLKLQADKVHTGVKKFILEEWIKILAGLPRPVFLFDDDQKLINFLGSTLNVIHIDFSR